MDDAAGDLGHASAVIALWIYAHLWPGKEDRTRAVVDTVLGGLRTGCGLSSATRGSEEWDAETCRSHLGNPGPAKGGQVGPGALRLGLRMKGVLASCSSRAVEFYGWIGALVQKE